MRPSITIPPPAPPQLPAELLVIILRSMVGLGFQLDSSTIILAIAILNLET